MVDFFQFDDETDVTDSLAMVGLSVITMFTYEFVWDLERIHQISLVITRMELFQTNPDLHGDNLHVQYKNKYNITKRNNHIYSKTMEIEFIHLNSMSL